MGGRNCKMGINHRMKERRRRGKFNKFFLRQVGVKFGWELAPLVSCNVSFTR